MLDVKVGVHLCISGRECLCHKLDIIFIESVDLSFCFILLVHVISNKKNHNQ